MSPYGDTAATPETAQPVEDRENGDLGTVAPLSGVLEASVIWYKKFHFI